jgi:hypothetical protein
MIEHKKDGNLLMEIQILAWNRHKVKLANRIPAFPLVMSRWQQR